MFTVALTGGIGCGKSLASDQFAELGVPIIDLDVISHQLTAANQPLLGLIAATFGNELITAEGELDRAAMRQKVFDNDTARVQLNAILHPAIYEKAVIALKTRALSHPETHYAILTIPLLYGNTDYSAMIDRILVVDCDEKIQITRVKKRNHLNEREIMQIINVQASREQRLSIADDVIENNGNVENLNKKITQLHEKYVNTCIVSKLIS